MYRADKKFKINVNGHIIYWNLSICQKKCKNFLGSKTPVKTEVLNSINFEKLAKIENKDSLYYASGTQLAGIFNCDRKTICNVITGGTVFLNFHRYFLQAAV